MRCLHGHLNTDTPTPTLTGNVKKNPPTRVGVHSLLTLCRIQNLSQNPKSKIRNPKFAQKDLLHNVPKSKTKIGNPKSKIQNPKSKIQNPKSEIQNPKSKIQNPKSKIPRQNPKFGWGPHKKNCYITIQNAKSKIPKIRPKSLDFGFWIGDFWILGILDCGFWILGRSGGCTTRQFGDGAWTSEARIPLVRQCKTNSI